MNVQTGMRAQINAPNPDGSLELSYFFEHFHNRTVEITKINNDGTFDVVVIGPKGKYGKKQTNVHSSFLLFESELLNTRKGHCAVSMS